LLLGHLIKLRRSGAGRARQLQALVRRQVLAADTAAHLQ
jgi:hypothetical protein